MRKKMVPSWLGHHDNSDEFAVFQGKYPVRRGTMKVAPSISAHRERTYVKTEAQL